jgi:diguanylate cyclase (GGDEF)-like protein
MLWQSGQNMEASALSNSAAERRMDIVADPRVEELQRELNALRREVRILRIANGELERVVVRDTLTPLYNRRYLVTALNERIARLDRYGTASVLVFVDVDGLKQINDAHGHNAGDFALCHIARQLAANVRATDVAARMGGDEFALVLDALNEEEAREKIAILDHAIANAPCDYAGTRLTVYASFGVATIRAGECDEAVLARADAAMYAAKREKRAVRTEN